jgi:hypothetical protein
MYRCANVVAAVAAPARWRTTKLCNCRSPAPAPASACCHAEVTKSGAMGDAETKKNMELTPASRPAIQPSSGLPRAIYIAIICRCASRAAIAGHDWQKRCAGTPSEPAISPTATPHTLLEPASHRPFGQTPPTVCVLRSACSMPLAIQTSASRCTAAFRTAGARGPRRAAAVCAAASQPQQPGLDRRQALLGLAVVLVGTKVQPALADGESRLCPSASSNQCIPSHACMQHARTSCRRQHTRN